MSFLMNCAQNVREDYVRVCTMRLFRMIGATRMRYMLNVDSIVVSHKRTRNRLIFIFFIFGYCLMLKIHWKIKTEQSTVEWKKIWWEIFDFLKEKLCIDIKLIENIPICIAVPKLRGSFWWWFIMSLRFRGRPFCAVPLLPVKNGGDSELDSL